MTAKMEEDVKLFLEANCERITGGRCKLNSTNFNFIKDIFHIVLSHSKVLPHYMQKEFKGTIKRHLYGKFNIPPVRVFIEFKFEQDSSDQFFIPIGEEERYTLKQDLLKCFEQPPLRVTTFEDIKNLAEDVAGDISLGQDTFIDVQGVSITEEICSNTVKVVVDLEVDDLAVSDLFKNIFGTSLLGRSCPFTRFDVQLNCHVRQKPQWFEFKLAFKEENTMKQLPEVKKIIHSGDYTHIIWEDDTKTTVKRAEDTPYDAYSAFAQAVLKKLYGSTEKAKFEHELRQLSNKEQKKVLAEKEARKEKQRKHEQRKLDRQLAQQEKELKEKEEQVQKTRAKRQSMFKRSVEV